MNKALIYTLVAIAVIVFLAVKNKVSRKQRLFDTLKQSFGKKNTAEYSSEKLKNIAKICENRDDLIDDITHNDLLLEDIFLNCDRTLTNCGREILYRSLHTQKVTQEERANRLLIMDKYSEDESFRLAVQERLSESGINFKTSLFSSLKSLNKCEKQGSLVHYLLMFLFIGSIFACLFYDAVIGLALILIFAAINTISYFKYKSKQAEYIESVKASILLIKCAKKLGMADSELPKLAEKFDKIIFGASFITTNGGNIFDFILDYVRMLTHIDIIQFNRIINGLKAMESDIWQIYEKIGYQDMLQSLSSYRKSLPYFCVAKNGSLYSVKELYHPLLNNPISNDMQTSKGLLISGSNASGKSTFLRSVGINQIFVQNFGFAFATEFSSPDFYIYSSMSLSDNLKNNESYYMAEIRSIKRIYDKASNTDIKVMILIDELLKGTNTIERIAAAAQILKKLCAENTLIMAATHDIELNNILDGYLDKYHFTEEICNEDVKFSYKILPGKATTRNAIKLLGSIGFDKKIIENAESEAQNFEKSGKWSTI